MRPKFFLKLTLSVLFSCAMTTALLVVTTIFFAYYYLNKPPEVIDLDKVINKDKPVHSKFFLISDSENDWSSLERFYAIDGLSQKSAVFHLGDITHLGVIEDFVKFKEISDNSAVTYNVVPGDRDLWKSTGIENFNQILGQSYNLVESNGSKFLLVDNSNEYEGVSDEQFKFIEDNINQADFVLLHNPIYFGNSSISSFIHKGMGQYDVKVDQQRLRLLELVRKSNVKAVFAGDQHLFSEIEDETRDSLKHYIVGALNAERSISGSSYVVLTVYTDGTYSVDKVAL